MAIDEYLRFEDGELRLGNDLLPGIFFSQTVQAGVRFDRAERDHMSGKNRIPLGWEDADIRFVSDLVCDDSSDCYEKLAIINKLFKSADKGANPKIYAISNRHLLARGVKRVVFTGLQSDEVAEDDVIRVTLTFSEHIPVVVKREKQANATKAATGAAPAAKTTPAASKSIVKEDNAFMAGFKAGNK